MSSKKLGCALILSSVITGCAVSPVDQGKQDKVVSVKTLQAREKTPKLPAKKVKKAPRYSSYTLSPTAELLIKQARKALVEGRAREALSILSRAQRVSPKAPQVYLEMAKVRIEQKLWGQAKQLVKKGLSLVGASSALKREAEGLLKAIAENG